MNLKLPLKVGDVMNINGDRMRRIDEADGMVVAFVTDQNLIDGTKRDEISEFIVRAVNSCEVLLAVAKRVQSSNGNDGPDMWRQLNQAINKFEGGTK